MAHFGHQRWWPGESPLEVCVGAILTQNTNWSNVQRAIANLKSAQRFDARKLLRIPESTLARQIRPAGYFNVKARRLRAFLQTLVRNHQGRLDLLFGGTRVEARNRLLAIPGIGPETADSMLLYAGGHASFVIDAYTRRIFNRHRWCAFDASYDHLQALCESSLLDRPADQLVDYWQDYHAQLVMTGKSYCRSRQPNCESCPLKALL